VRWVEYCPGSAARRRKRPIWAAWYVSFQAAKVEYKDIYRLLFKARGYSDYEPRYKPLEAETLQLLGDAERFVQRMEKFLRDQGY